MIGAYLYLLFSCTPASEQKVLTLKFQKITDMFRGRWNGRQKKMNTGKEGNITQ